MPTNTTNFSLIKPGQEEFYNVDVPNANMDTIDGVLKTLQDAISSGASEQDLKVLRDALATHLAERASLTEVGHVQLSNLITGTSESKAATELAVKNAYDKLYSMRYLINGFVGIDSTGKSMITRNGANSYNNSHLELQSTDGTDVILGFHRSGATATALVHDGDMEGLKLETSVGALAPFRAGNIYSNGSPVLTAESSVPKIATGSYIGNALERTINVGFTPKFLYLFAYASATPNAPASMVIIPNKNVGLISIQSSINLMGNTNANIVEGGFWIAATGATAFNTNGYRYDWIASA